VNTETISAKREILEVESAERRPVSIFAQGIRLLFESSLKFTGEQYTPGSGIEICYEHLHRYAFVCEALSETDVVLDLACGSGYGTILLSQKCKHVYAIDRDAQSIAVLKRVIEELGIKNVTVFEMDLDGLLAGKLRPEMPLTAVVCHEFIEHIEAEAQQSLVTNIASGTFPFSEGIKFFVSTPEKLAYDSTLEHSNPYHLNELSPEEFQQLLRRSFKNTDFFWQANTSANCLYPMLPYERSEKIMEADSVATFIDWLDPIRLVASLSAVTKSNGVFLYAVASNGALPSLPTVSSLLDPLQRAVDEKTARIVTERDELRRTIENLQETFSAREEALQLQAEKITALLVENERLGHQVNASPSREELLAEVEDYQARIQELEPWKLYVLDRLGPTLGIAEEHVALMQSHVRAMRSPAHRLVAFVGRTAGQTLPGRMLRRGLAWLTVICKA